MRSTQKKNHQNPSTNKKSAGGSKSPPPLGALPKMKDIGIPRVNFQIKKIGHIRNFINESVTKKLVTSLILSVQIGLY